MRIVSARGYHRPADVETTQNQQRFIRPAMVGRDGVANGTSALDGKVSLHTGIIQVAGTAALIDPEVLRKLAHEFGPLQSLLIRHEQVLLAQAQQSAGCNAGQATS